jgi:hypothetical protein
MKALIALALLGSAIAYAKDKPQYTYQDGVFQSFRTEQPGRTAPTQQIHPAQ